MTAWAQEAFAEQCRTSWRELSAGVDAFLIRITVLSLCVLGLFNLFVYSVAVSSSRDQYGHNTFYAQSPWL